MGRNNHKKALSVCAAMLSGPLLVIGFMLLIDSLVPKEKHISLAGHVVEGFIGIMACATGAILVYGARVLWASNRKP